MNNNNKFLQAVKEINSVIGANNVLRDEAALCLNSFDGSPVRIRPDAVINIPSAEVLPSVIKILNAYKIPFIPRTAATNHDGGCIAVKGGCILNLSALNEITLIDTQNGYAVAECGVINKDLQDALEPLGFFYAPDPASMAFCTVGGNAALNAGGPRTLKYGSTASNILKAEFVTPQGEVLLLDRHAAGPDVLSLLVKSEGTLGIITKLWLKILPKQPALKTISVYFKTLQDTVAAVEDIIRAGIIPSALEAMDKANLEVTKTPCPQGTDAFLLIELDGKKSAVEKEALQVLGFCQKHNALKTETASSQEQRLALWKSRKSAAAAMAKLAPNLVSLDGGIPRSNLPSAIGSVADIIKKYGLRGGMVFHAGDGNMHPNIAFDERNVYETLKVKQAVKEINMAEAAAKGTISAEHGIGVEKRAAMAFMFEDSALALFKNIKKAFDPYNVSNPDKVLPVASSSRLKASVPDDEETLKIIKRVKECYSAKTKVSICALKTNFKPKGEILDLSRLNKITDIDKNNFMVTVQAGTAVKTLAAELAKDNMYLPFPVCKGSIGGVFASKIFDNFADYVTAVDFVMADGTFIRLGGKYVKNSAGYDIIRLLSGSMGFYAALTALTVRVCAVKPATCVQREFAAFTPSEQQLKLKKVFDEYNIFNGCITGADNATR